MGDMTMVSGEISDPPNPERAGVFPTAAKTRRYSDHDMWYSPPIQSGNRAVRYVAKRTHVEYLAYPAAAIHWIEVAEDWSHYPSRNAWAADTYGRDPIAGHGFSYDSSARAPKRLFLRWYPELLHFLYQDRQDVLTSRLAHFRTIRDHERAKARATRDRLKTHEGRYGRPDHGDMVLVAKPIPFTDGVSHQAFVLFRDERGRLVPHIAWQNAGGALLFRSVRVKNLTRIRMMKIGPEAFASAGNIAAHERVRLTQLARDIRAMIDAEDARVAA